MFSSNACPPEALATLGQFNKRSKGLVEAYIYGVFKAKISAVGAILSLLRSKTPESFDLGEIISSFEQKPGLKRSIDKVFEITVFALFATIVRALQLEVSLTISNTDPAILNHFSGFLEKAVGLPPGETTMTIPASLFRLGATNAADRGLDMVASFGPAIQVKHLTLDAEAIADICDGLSADRVVIVCKATELTIVDAVITQLGFENRLQGLVTYEDLKEWYKTCLNPPHRTRLGAALLDDFVREFSNEFPGLDGVDGFLKHRGYQKLTLSGDWTIST